MPAVSGPLLQQRISNMVITLSTVILETQEDFEKLLREYECSSFEELSDYLWLSKNITLIWNIQTTKTY